MKKWLVIVMFLPFLSFSQQKDPGKAVFHSIVSGGAMLGETRTKAFFQYSLGVNFYNFYAGLGVGYDAYRYNTIPVFADARYSFLGRRKVMFVYGNLGVGIPGNYKKETFSEFERDRTRPGLYTDVGIGYKFLLRRTNNFFVSVGHSIKQWVNVKDYEYPCGFLPCNQDPYDFTYRSNFYRMSFKAGWEFGN
jgi:hypothetical protein